MTKLLEQVFAAASKLPSPDQDALAARWLAELADAAPSDDASIDLVSRGIKAEEADELRWRLATFAEGWNAPEMSDYDNYQPPAGQS